MQIRRIRAEEWPRYREIRLAALEQDPGAFGSTWQQESALDPAEWRQRASRAATTDDRAVFVAVGDDGRWYGLAGGIRPGTPPSDVELVSMWVHPSARGAALGGRLVEAVLGWARGHGDRTAALWVARGNAPAVALYERSGFVPTGDVQPLPSDPCRDELRMTRELRVPARRGGLPGDVPASSGAGVRADAHGPVTGPGRAADPLS